MRHKITDGSGNVFEDLGLENAGELFEKTKREIAKAKEKGRKTDPNSSAD